MHFGEDLIDELERQTEEIRRLRPLEPEVNRLNDEVRSLRGEVERLELLTRRRNDSAFIRSSGSPVARRPLSDAADYSHGETGSRGGGDVLSRFWNDEDVTALPVYSRSESQLNNLSAREICPVCHLDFPDQETLIIHVEECLK